MGWASRFFIDLHSRSVNIPSRKRGLIFLLALCFLASGCVSKKTHRRELGKLSFESAQLCIKAIGELEHALNLEIASLQDELSKKNERLRRFNQVDPAGFLYPPDPSPEPTLTEDPEWAK